MGKKLNHNLMLYVRLILRQERIRIAIWLVAILMLVLVVTQAYMELTPTEQERQVMAENHGQSGGNCHVWTRVRVG